MNEVTRAVDEVKALYEKVIGQPAPEVPSSSFVPFPPGVDPVRHALDEVNLVKQLAARIASSPTPISWVPLADVFAQGNDIVIQLEIPALPGMTGLPLVPGVQNCFVRKIMTCPAKARGTRSFRLRVSRSNPAKVSKLTVVQSA